MWRIRMRSIGMCICNDRRWPETYRVMGLQGVEIVALGYNTPIQNIHHREPMHLRMFHHLVVDAGQRLSERAPGCWPRQKAARRTGSA